MRRTDLSKLIALSFTFALSACQTNPPDEPICSEITLDRGVCTRMLSGETFIVDEVNRLNGRTWWEMRPMMLQMPASTWAEIKVYIIRVCKRYGCRDPEIASWDRAVENIDRQLEQRNSAEILP